MNDVKDVDKNEIKRIEQMNSELQGKIEKLNDNIFEMNHNLNFMKNANTELTNNVNQLDQKYKVQKNKEDFFKNEIKKGLLELNSLREPVEEYERIKDQIARDKIELQQFKNISNNVKEFIWSFNGMTKRTHVQTDITQDYFEYKIPVVEKNDKKNQENESNNQNQNSNNSLHISKIKELYQALEKKKIELLEGGSKLHPNEKCQYCYRYGNDSKMTN